MNIPPCDFSTSVVFAGCGVLNGWNRLDFGASGAFTVAAPLSLFAPNRLNPELLPVAAGVSSGFGSAANGFGLGASVDAVLRDSSGFLRLPNKFDGVPAVSAEDLFSVVGRFANGLLGAELVVPKRLVEGAVDVALSDFCAVALKLNRFDAGAVAVAFGVPCALVPRPPKGLLCFGVSELLSLFCALEPKPPKMLFAGAGDCLGASSFCALAPNVNVLVCDAAGCAELPNPLNRPLVAGVLAVFEADVVEAPNVKGVDAGAGVLVAFGAPLVVPNMPLGAALEVPNIPPEGAALDVPNIPPEGAALDAPNMPPVGAALDVPNILPDGAALDVPNIPPEGVELVVPNMPPEGAELVVLFWPRPPKGFPCVEASLPNIDDPPKAGAGVFPLVAGAEFAFANGFAPPAVKLKPADDGGVGLKPVPWLLPPKAGKDELEKVLLGAAGCAGGKLLVAPPPKALLLPKPFAPLFAGAGAEAPKLKAFCCGAPKFALCERP